MVDRKVMQAGRYKAYPEYKDSGVEWLGEVPIKWGLIKSSITFFTAKGENAALLTNEYCESRDSIYPVYSGKTEDGGLMGMIDTFEFDFSKNGCVISTTVGAKAMTVRYSNERFSLSQNCMIIYPREPKIYKSKYYYYFFQPMFQYFRQLIPDYMQPSFRMEDFKAYRVAVPATDEQEKIVNFLDYETAKIDTLIEKQQRLIELLTEKRQAVISHAVTKGLNPNVPMKDSGVEWLGEVPAHWELPKLIQQTSRIGDGLHSTPKYQDNTGYYFVNGNNLVNGQIVIGVSAKEVPEDEYIKHFIPLDETSVLLSINGTIGNVARYKGEKVILGKSASYMNCSNQLTPEYLILYLQSSQVRHYFDLEVTGTTIYNLSLNSLRQMKVCIPPKSEQLDIDGYCNAQKDKYDFLIEKANLQIQLMQERRTALISAAVTGKIDVRNWVKPE